MRTSFIRPETPLRIETADRGQRKLAAIRPISSSLAFPSTGGDFSCASQRPSSDSDRALVRALGFTLTRMVFTKTEVYA